MESSNRKSFHDHREDTARVNELNKKANNYFQTSLDSVSYFSGEALRLAEQLKYKNGTATALKILCSYNRNKGNFDVSLEQGLRALKLYEELQDKDGLADTYLQIAQVYKELGGDRKTMAYIMKGADYTWMAYALYSGLKDTAAMIASLNVSGIIYRDWAREKGYARYYDTAFACYTKALLLNERSGKGTASLGKIYNNFSHYYTEYKKDYTGSLGYLMKAVTYNKEYNNISSLSFNYGNISEVYRKMSDNKRSLEYALKTLTLAQQLNSPTRLVNAYNQLQRCYTDNKMYDSALFYYKAYDMLSDSLGNIDKTRQIADMQTKYETVKKETEINRLNSENSQQNRRIVILVSGLAAFIIIAGALILLYRRVVNQKMLITRQSQQLETMMKELHHRVKNNLQIVSSLLSLQTYRMNDEGAKAAITQSQQRVQAMSFIHQRLYKTDELTSVNVKEYITDLVESLMASYGYGSSNFALTISVDKELLDVDKALPIGLIVNEIVTNAFKYAYKNVEHPSLKIVCTENNNNIILSIKDNGNNWDEIKWKQSDGSFGSQLVTTLCRQLRAKQSLVIEDGTQFIFTIPQKAQTA